MRRCTSRKTEYNWVGIYLMRDRRAKLWLHNYVGAPTEHAEIEVGQGVCGTAVAEKANQKFRT